MNDDPSYSITAITLQTIAAATGYSKATVSLALKGDRRIPEATRETIVAAARRLGYTPSPAIRRWMSEIRRPRSQRTHLKIALINNWSHPLNAEGPDEPLAGFYEGAVARAAELGYVWDEFETRESLHEFEKLHTTLWKRGYDGGLIFPSRNPAFQPDYATCRFPVVVVGQAVPNPGVTQALPDHYYNAALACRHLLARGCARIGMAIASHVNARTYGRYVGAYLATLHAAGLKPLPLCAGEEPSMKALARFIARHRCDGLLVGAHVSLHDPALAGLNPDHVPMATYSGLYRSDREQRLSGIDEGWSRVGAIAMEALAKKIELGGGPATGNPEHLLLPGTWVDGAT